MVERATEAFIAGLDREDFHVDTGVDGWVIDGSGDIRVAIRAAIEAMRDALMPRILEILDGIDRSEIDHPEGWWETSTGVEFGAERLRLLDELFTAALGEK
jgi:hypothetical protein